MPDGSIVQLGGFDGTRRLNETWRFVPTGSLIQSPSHTYTVPGTYQVSLQASNTNGYNSTRKAGYITVGAPEPVAGFTGTPTTGTVPLTVKFMDTSTNTPTSWSWAFGDSDVTNATVQNPVHTYSTAGTFTVTLNATNAGGSNVSVRTGYITVRVPGPVSGFSANITSGPAPLPVAFTDQSTRTPSGWAWFFGDENYTQPWTQQTAGAEWSGRYPYASVLLPDLSVLVLGGATEEGYKNDVWRSTNNGAHWTLVNGNASWSARQGHSSVVLADGSIVLMGGWNDSSYYNDTWRSTDNGVTWTQQTANAEWSQRQYHTTVVMLDGSIVLAGGKGGDNSPLNDVWRSVDNGATWNLQTTSAAWQARNGHTCVVTPDGSIILSGGYADDAKNDTWRSTDYGVTWIQQSDTGNWSARFSHTSVVMPDGSIVLAGGKSGGRGGIYFNDTWRSTDHGSTWSQVNASSGWAARYEHTSVAMPNGSVLILGGFYPAVGNAHDVWSGNFAGSPAQNPGHTYTTPGTYQVSLQAYNSGGYNNTIKAAYITVTLPAPVAGFTATSTTGTVPLTVKFTDTSTNTPTSWNWSFGDGSLVNATVQNPVHTYSAAGTYRVSLNATNAG